MNKFCTLMLLALTSCAEFYTEAKPLPNGSYDIVFREDAYSGTGPMATEGLKIRSQIVCPKGYVVESTWATNNGYTTFYHQRIHCGKAKMGIGVGIGDELGSAHE